MRTIQEKTYKKIGEDKYETVYVTRTDYNVMDFPEMSVRKYEDGSHEFQLHGGYDEYNTTLSNQHAKMLSEFLLRPYKESSD